VGGHRLGRWASLPLSPTHKLRTATPVAHGAVGLGSLSERFMGKQIVVCHLPVPLLGARPQSPPSSSCLQARKILHPRIGPRDGDPYGVSRTLVPRRGPSRHPLSNVLKIHAQSVVNFGELSAPLISGARRPAPRPPSGDGTCRPESPTLGLCLRPSL
jgi:hypothetical protein